MEDNNFNSLRKFRIVLPFAVFAMVIAVFAWRTQGFKAFTTYSYEFVKADPIGKPLPDNLFILKDDSSRVELNSLGNHYTLVGIVYLKCQIVCPIINQRLYEIYQVLELDSIDEEHSKPERTKSLSNKIQLMTLSFDYKRDSVSDLNAYKKLFFNDIKSNKGNKLSSTTAITELKEQLPSREKNWIFAVVDHPKESFIKRKLSEMGFWFFEYQPGMYNHSPYLYLMGPNGVIQKVYDPGKLSNHEIIVQLQNDVH